MKTLFIIVGCLLILTKSYTQSIEVQGELKVTNVAESTTSDSVLMYGVDGTFEKKNVNEVGMPQVGIVKSEIPNDIELIDLGYVNFGAIESDFYNLPQNGTLHGNWSVIPEDNSRLGIAYGTAIWTGSEMIIWGGSNDTTSDINFGYKFNPNTMSWQHFTGANTPAGRREHFAFWTGTRMIIWGGAIGNIRTNTGSRYNPTTNSWSVIQTNNAPIYPGATAVWTGFEMIVFGGTVDGTNSNSGARYNPNTNTWSPTSLTNAPTLGAGSTVVGVWTGVEMLVWDTSLRIGAKYNPEDDQWTSINPLGSPSTRSNSWAVWTGSEMIIWGGSNLNTGGKYNPATDTWSNISTNNAPIGRNNHRSIWTGSEMIVWGGSPSPTILNNGGKYNPVTNTWIRTSELPAPKGRGLITPIWTGDRMIFWGGLGGSPAIYFNDGGIYFPNENGYGAQEKKIFYLYKKM